MHFSEIDFEAITENSPDIISVVDREYRHVYVNPAVERATGRPREDFLGRTNHELDMPADLVRFWDDGLAMVFASGQTHHMEFPFVVNGETRHFQAVMVPQKNADGKVVAVLSNARDVTPLRATDMRIWLSETQRLLNDVLHAVQDQVCVLSTDLRVLFVNDAMRRRHLSKGQMEGRFCYEVFHGRSCPCKTCQSLTAMRTKQPAKKTFQYPGTAGKSTFHEAHAHPMLDISGQVLGVVEYIRDITQERRARRKLAESERTLRNVFNGCCDAIIIHDHQGAILQVNARMLEMFRCKRRALINLPVSELIDTQHCGLPALDLGPDGQKNDFPLYFEALARQPGGPGLFLVEACVTRIRFKGRDALMCILRDIATRKQAEVEMIRIQGELERECEAKAQRMEEFAAQMRYEAIHSKTILENINIARKHLSILSSPGLAPDKEDMPDGEGPLKTLSKREYQVMLLLAEGMRPKDIAGRMELDPRTVSTYILRIQRKLGASGADQVLRIAREGFGNRILIR